MPGAGGIQPAPAGGPREPPARVTLANEPAPRVTIAPRVAGTAHVFLSGENDGSPATSYRRIILSIAEQ